MLCFRNLLHATRESRAVTLEWLEKQGTIEHRLSPEHGYVLERAFDPKKDFVFLSVPDMVNGLWGELLYHVANSQQSISDTPVHISKIVVSENILQTNTCYFLMEMARYFDSLQSIDIINDTHAFDTGSTGEAPGRWAIRRSLSGCEMPDVLCEIIEKFKYAMMHRIRPSELYRESIERFGRLPFEVQMAELVRTNPTANR